MKVCTKCKEALPLSEFRKQSSTKDGLKYCCKECDNKAAKSYYKHSTGEGADNHLGGYLAQYSTRGNSHQVRTHDSGTRIEEY